MAGRRTGRARPGLSDHRPHPARYATHPRAIRETERLPNTVFSHLLGREVDLSAGSKGFSASAARFLLRASPRGRALGTDAGWPVLLHRAGFSMETLFVDGLEWESADRHRETPADRERQSRLGRAVDSDPRQWAWRVSVANEILQTGLEALTVPLPER